MIHSSKTRPKLIGADMTPMIDVVFLLLVFFLYAVMHMVEAKGIKLTLPKAAEAETVKTSPLTIDITRDETVMIQERILEPDDLVTAVNAAIANDLSRGILIRADRDSRTGLTVSVMSRLKNAGYDAVTLAVEEEAQ